VRSGTLRPKDMKIRGPLGEAEARAVLALDKVVESERSRMERSRYTGEMTRPIDVPGPLGEFEKYVGDIIRAERQRVKDRERNDGKLVRPKDASLQSGLGDVERKAVEDWEKLAKEEKERYQSFKRFLEERRPADADKDSPLGLMEAFTVKLLNGPRLIMDGLSPKDQDNAILLRRMQEIREKDGVLDEDGSDGRDGRLSP
jgi:mRNA-degrading endonuclease RelE of RelBE toxin-antitoxin system